MPILSHIYTITNWLSVCTALGDILTFVYTSWYRSLFAQPLNVIFSLLNVCVHCCSLSTSKIFVHAQIVFEVCQQIAHTQRVSSLNAVRMVCASAVYYRFIIEGNSNNLFLRSTTTVCYLTVGNCPTILWSCVHIKKSMVPSLELFDWK